MAVSGTVCGMSCIKSCFVQYLTSSPMYILTQREKGCETKSDRYKTAVVIETEEKLRVSTLGAVMTIEHRCRKAALAPEMAAEDFSPPQ